MISDCEVSSDKGRGLTSDPRGERLGALRLVVFDHLDRAGNGIWVEPLLRRRSRSWGGGRTSIVLLPWIRSWVARLGTSQLSISSILLSRVSCWHSRLRRRRLL